MSTIGQFEDSVTTGMVTTFTGCGGTDSDVLAGDASIERPRGRSKSLRGETLQLMDLACL